MLKLRGSLTVEASIILPFVLMLFAGAMKSGISLYEETRDMAISIARTESPNILKRFYQWKMLEESIDEQKKN